MKNLNLYTKEDWAMAHADYEWMRKKDWWNTDEIVRLMNMYTKYLEKPAHCYSCGTGIAGVKDELIKFFGEIFAQENKYLEIINKTEENIYTDIETAETKLDKAKKNVKTYKKGTKKNEGTI